MKNRKQLLTVVLTSTLHTFLSSDKSELRSTLKPLLDSKNNLKQSFNGAAVCSFFEFLCKLEIGRAFDTACPKDKPALTQLLVNVYETTQQLLQTPPGFLHNLFNLFLWEFVLNYEEKAVESLRTALQKEWSAGTAAVMCALADLRLEFPLLAELDERLGAELRSVTRTVFAEESKKGNYRVLAVVEARVPLAVKKLAKQTELDQTGIILDELHSLHFAALEKYTKTGNKYALQGDFAVVLNKNPHGSLAEQLRGYFAEKQESVAVFVEKLLFLLDAVPFPDSELATNTCRDLVERLLDREEVFVFLFLGNSTHIWTSLAPELDDEIFAEEQCAQLAEPLGCANAANVLLECLLDVCGDRETVRTKLEHLLIDDLVDGTTNHTKLFDKKEFLEKAFPKSFLEGLLVMATELHTRIISTDVWTTEDGYFTSRAQFEVVKLLDSALAAKLGFPEEEKGISFFALEGLGYYEVLLNKKTARVGVLECVVLFLLDSKRKVCIEDLTKVVDIEKESSKVQAFAKLVEKELIKKCQDFYVLNV